MSSSSTEKKHQILQEAPPKQQWHFMIQNKRTNQCKTVQDLIDKTKASSIVNQVFNEETLKEGYKRKLRSCFLIIPPTCQE